MLPPDYLINNLEPLTEIFNNYHTEVLKDITRRLIKSVKRTGNLALPETAQYQVEKLVQSGLPQYQIELRVNELLRATPEFLNILSDEKILLQYSIRELSDFTIALSEKEMQELFEDAAIKNISFDNKVYKSAGLPEINIAASPQMLNILDANRLRTNTTVRNLMGTFAANSQEKLYDTLNQVYMQVITGVKSYTSALNEAIDSLARDGVTIYYPQSRRNVSLESAILTTIRTSVSQTAAELTMQSMRELNVELVQVSAHRNARNTGTGHQNHESWQGKIYKLN